MLNRLFKKGDNENKSAEYNYKIKLPLESDQFDSSEVEQLTMSIQDLLNDYFWQDEEITDLLMEEYDNDEDRIGDLTVSFKSNKQFRWEHELEELEESMPLISKNLMVSFTQEGGIFSDIALLILPKKAQSTIDISFYNEELDRWYDVQISKNKDEGGEFYGTYDQVN
jgi:hypothetical protein